ncbi:MAG: hypothetical protein ACM3WS_08780 [Bacillota bacterium]
MPTTDPQDTLPASVPDNDSIPEHDLRLEEDRLAYQAQSEAARRINLLGKLIIPPSAP